MPREDAWMRYCKTGRICERKRLSLYQYGAGADDRNGRSQQPGRTNNKICRKKFKDDLNIIMD